MLRSTDCRTIEANVFRQVSVQISATQNHPHLNFFRNSPPQTFVIYWWLQFRFSEHCNIINVLQSLVRYHRATYAKSPYQVLFKLIYTVHTRKKSSSFASGIIFNHLIRWELQNPLRPDNTEPGFKLCLREDSLSSSSPPPAPTRSSFVRPAEQWTGLPWLAARLSSSDR